MKTTDLQIGQALPALATGPITRLRIVKYTHGSGDLNPIHVDPDFAREKAGLPDVIVHGMYSMGMLSRLLARWAGPASVRSIDTRFAAMLPVHASLVCEGVVQAIEPVDGGAQVTVMLTASREDGSSIASGTALVFVRD